MYGTAKDSEGKSYSDSEYAFIIKNSEGYGKNLLMVTESYGRVIRDVLASHFDTTVYLDYRLFSKIPIDYLIEKYHIDVLLMVSNSRLWNTEEFLFSFRRDE